MIKKDKSGFTIIEVVLVLAIAGLIFLMVFIALPALQRSQRDTQRRNDMARVATALTQWQTNHGGELLSAGTDTFSGCTAGSSGTKPAEINPQNLTGPNACKFIGGYLNSSSSNANEFKDPDGTHYGIKAYGKTYTAIADLINNWKTKTFDHIIYIIVSSKCNGEVPEYTGNTREYSLLYKLEGAGTICIDNS